MSDQTAKPEDIVSKLDATSVGDENIEKLYSILQEGSKDQESIEDRENKGILILRNRWANWVLILIVLIVCFDMVLVTLVGIGVWTFTNTSIVIAVITDNFLKIVGLGYLITSKIFEKIFKDKIYK